MSAGIRAIISSPEFIPFLYYVAGICAVTFIVSKTAYNLYFHPLAKIPGPWLGRATEWYLFFVICSIPTLGHELHKKYGRS